MKQPRVAHRYAKALLALSKETNKTDEVFQDMNLISKTVSDSKDFASVLKSPIVKSDKKEAIFTAIFSSKVSELTNKYLKLLVERKRESLLGEIADAFIYTYKKDKNIIIAEVTSAVKLDTTLRDKVLKIVRGEGTEEVELLEKIDPSIIGGFIVRIDDKQVDASISRRFSELRKNFS